MEGIKIENGNSNESEIKSYEERLWQRAEEFSVIREALEKNLSELDELFSEKPINTLNLHEKQLRIEEEDRYWKTKAEIDKIKDEESKLEEVLVELGNGILNKDKLESILPEQNTEEIQLSKRKKKILEEKRRLGLDPRAIMSDMYGEFGPEKMRLTTGRHATGIKNLGSVDPLSAASMFYYASTDTHGGKVAYGKNGTTYVSNSGKRVRKK